MPAVSYRRFQAEVLEVYRPPLKSKKTFAKVRQVLREVGRLPGVKKTSDLKPVTIARWLAAHRGRAPATQDSLLRSFRSACMLAVASGYLKASPFAFRRRWVEVRPSRRGDRHHPIAVIRDVLALAGVEAGSGDWKARRLEALVCTYAFTGLRRGEALRLRKSDVDLDARLIHVRRGAGPLKTAASEAPVPIPPPLAVVLARWLPLADGRWVFPNVSRKGPWTGGPPGHKPLDQVKALGRRAGVDNLTISSFRHSFATHSRRWGLGELMVKAILRHTTVRTQQHYLHADPDDLRAAGDAVSYDLN